MVFLDTQFPIFMIQREFKNKEILIFNVQVTKNTQVFFKQSYEYRVALTVQPGFTVRLAAGAPQTFPDGLE